MVAKRDGVPLGRLNEVGVTIYNGGFGLFISTVPSVFSFRIRGGEAPPGRGKEEGRAAAASALGGS